MSKGGLDCQRTLFDLPGDITYLNCAYQSPQLKHSTECAIKQLGQKSRPWSMLPDDFFGPAEVLRERFADLIDAEPDDIAIVPSISYAMATAAANLPNHAGRHTVMLAEQFPSHVYAKNSNPARDVLMPADAPMGSAWQSQRLPCNRSGYGALNASVPIRPG